MHLDVHFITMDYYCKKLFVILFTLIAAVQCVSVQVASKQSTRTHGRDDVINTLQQGTLQDFEVVSRMLEDQLLRLEDHSRRLAQMEAVRNRGCEKESNRNAGLIQDLFDRVNRLEDRLNSTLNQNADLRQELDSLKPSFRRRRAFDDHDAEGPQRPPQQRPNALTEDKVKRPVIAFDAFRNQPFYKAQSYLTFNGTTVNIGGAFDPSTGLFIAPVSGVYSFSFHGLTYDGTATHIKIMKNGENVGGAYRRHEGEGDEEHESLKAGLKKAEGMLAQSLLLELVEGDEVAVYAYHGNLRDGAWHYTHFTGYLI